MSLRKIYYTLPASFRLYARQIMYWPEDAIRSLINQGDDLLPPKRLIYTGRGNFINTGIKFTSLSIQFAELQESGKVLDIGCGIGRMAIPLTNILSEKGQYTGFDLMKPGIAWCQKNITPRFPNFNFQWVDLRNDLYKQSGNSSLDYSFPAAKNSTDLIFSISVFTHIAQKEFEHYMKESFRCLKSEGYIICSFFVIDDEQKKSQCHDHKFSFPHDYNSYFLMNDKLPSANIAFLRSYLENFFTTQGYTIKHYFPGHWKGESEASKDFQDIYILQKP